MGVVKGKIRSLCVNQADVILPEWQTTLCSDTGLACPSCGCEFCNVSKDEKNLDTLQVYVHDMDMLF